MNNDLAILPLDPGAESLHGPNRRLAIRPTRPFSKSEAFTEDYLASLAGCDEYLTKPVDENHLLEVIAKFLPSARAGGG